MTIKSIFAFLTIGLFAASVSFASSVSQDNPEVMVKELSQVILTELEAQRVELEADPSKVKAFADDYILPYVDTKKMARYVMGRYWKQASSEQQQEFVDAFTNTLLNAYSKSILKLKVTSIDVSKMLETKKGRASVETNVTQADGNETKVVYRAFLNKKDQKWYIFDVSIEGISMLLNYRKSFASEFQKKTVGDVIASLNAKLVPQSEEE